MEKVGHGCPFYVNRLTLSFPPGPEAALSTSELGRRIHPQEASGKRDDNRSRGNLFSTECIAEPRQGITPSSALRACVRASAPESVTWAFQEIVLWAMLSRTPPMLSARKSKFKVS